MTPREVVTVRMKQLMEHVRLQYAGWPDDFIELWELVTGQELDTSRSLDETVEELAVMIQARFGNEVADERREK